MRTAHFVKFVLGIETDSVKIYIAQLNRFYIQYLKKWKEIRVYFLPV